MRTKYADVFVGTLDNVARSKSELARFEQSDRSKSDHETRSDGADVRRSADNFGSTDAARRAALPVQRGINNCDSAFLA